MKKVKKYITLALLCVLAIISVIADILMQSNCKTFNEVNRILFTLVSVAAGFWVTCYLLFLQIYKDRYPINFLKNSYLPQMKYNMTYIIYCIIFGCFVVIKNGGVFENLWYADSALFTIFLVLWHIYSTSKTMMVNTYVDEYCEEISVKLNDGENSVNKGVFRELRYVLDECIVKEEYYVALNISSKSGDIFRDFLENSIKLRNKEGDVEQSFERIVKFGLYQLELCEDIGSELLLDEISSQQLKNIEFCIEKEQYEWFKKYIKMMGQLNFRLQKDGKEKVVSEIYGVYTNILDDLLQREREEWVRYMIDKLFSMTTSLNFISSNINLKYFASLITFGLLNCNDGPIQDYLYEVFEKFTSIVCSISKGFCDIKVYYALYFDHVMKNKNCKQIKEFFDTIFRHGQAYGNDITWTEFKFYCVGEANKQKEKGIEIDVLQYHIKLLVEVIEMKEQYDGYMFLPAFEEQCKAAQYSRQDIEKICDDIRYLLNKCVISDNLNMFFVVIKSVNTCMMITEARNKDLQLILFSLFVWLIERTKKLNNKQFMEIVFAKLEDIINELDKKRVISSDFGDTIVVDLTNLARHSDSDSQEVVLQIIDLLSDFLKENKEMYFISNSPERKEKLYRGVYNIATSCIENDFEEGVRRCSNTIGWFTIYSIKQTNTKLTKYLIKLASEMLEIAVDMNVTIKTQTFLLTLFTTVGMYCCKEPATLLYVELILQAIEHMDKQLVYTAIKIHTCENDMWDDLFDKKTSELAAAFRKTYDTYLKKI